MKKANLNPPSNDFSLSGSSEISVERLAQDDEPLYTGRYIASLREGATDSRNLQKVISDKAGILMAMDSDYNQAYITEDDLGSANALIFDDLGIALISPDEGQLSIMEDNATDYIVEPEQIMYAPDPIVMAGAEATFGLDLTKVVGSSYSGKGIKVAVLDTGMDLKHPDFKGRTIIHQSFISGESVQDGNGHGTHCIGTACGDTDNSGMRYGIAKDAEIYAGKVLSNAGSGSQSGVLNGMSWAIKSKCDIISMSLGSRIFPGQGYSPAYERVAKIALENNTLIIAAAGNESRRHQGIFSPVGSPANCPSILAVGAIDAQLNMAHFSNRSINPTGQVDIAAPGVNIYSSWPMSKRYRTISGTSMATPHVAGIAALYREKTPSISAKELWWHLSLNARRLMQTASDVGVGLAIAP